MSANLDLATVEMAFFEPILNEKFSARPWGGPTGQAPRELELVRAVDNPASGQEGQRVPFALFFDGPIGVTLEQGLHTVTHPQTGEMLIFLVPVGRKNDRLQLQAVFN